MARPRKRADGESLEYRFFLRVEKTDSCWLWTGPIKEKGYGKFSIGRSGVRAHRWLWQHLNGSPSMSRIVRGLERRHVK